MYNITGDASGLLHVANSTIHVTQDPEVPFIIYYNTTAYFGPTLKIGENQNSWAIISGALCGVDDIQIFSGYIIFNATFVIHTF